MPNHKPRDELSSIHSASNEKLLDENNLHSYQRFCVDFIEQHPQCGIFLDMGLGKTATLR